MSSALVLNSCYPRAIDALLGDRTVQSGRQPWSVQGEDGGGERGAGGIMPQRIIHAEIKRLLGEPDWSSRRLAPLQPLSGHVKSLGGKQPGFKRDNLLDLCRGRRCLRLCM